MNKEPTPIRGVHRRPSAPEPITLPPPMTFDQRIRRNIYRILYPIFRSREHFDMSTMSFDEFVLVIERMIEESAV